MSRFLEMEIALYQDQEAWKADHDDVMRYYDTRERIEFGIHLFDRLNQIDEDVQLNIFNKEIGDEAGKDLRERLDQLYRQWLAVSEQLGELAAELEEKGHPVESWEKLSVCIREVRGIITPDDQFFTGPALIELRDKALDEHRRGLTEAIDGASRQ